MFHVELTYTISTGRKISRIEVKWNGMNKAIEIGFTYRFEYGGEWMNISLQKLLAKMEAEIRLARSAETEAAQREKIHSIKTLCELVLEEPSQQGTGKYVSNESGRTVSPPSPQYAAPQPGYVQPQLSVSQPAPVMHQPKKLEMDDHSNGDSLFDF